MLNFSNSVNTYVRLRNTDTYNNDAIVTNNSITLSNHTYTYKNIFENKSNREVYKEIFERINKDSFTMICYGQTGSGKTYTLLNKESNNLNLETKDTNDNTKDTNDNVKDDNLGLMWMFLSELSNTHNSTFTLSIFEIYLDDIYDLLNDRYKCTIYSKSSELLIQNLSKKACYSVDDLVTKIQNALILRQTKETISNNNSSRSHLIIEITDKHNKYSFVDLAGSERIKRNNFTNIKESISINSNLLALGNVISGISQNKNGNLFSFKYIPWRGSKLTRILQHIVINQIVFIGCIKIEDIKEAQNTLMYVERMDQIKEIKYVSEKMKKVKFDCNINKSNDNSIASNKKILQLEKEIAKLEDMLSNCICQHKQKIQKHPNKKVTFNLSENKSVLVRYEGNNSTTKENNTNIKTCSNTIVNAQIFNNILTFRYRTSTNKIVQYVVHGICAYDYLIHNNKILLKDKQNKMFVVKVIGNTVKIEEINNQ